MPLHLPHSALLFDVAHENVTYPHRDLPQACLSLLDSCAYKGYSERGVANTVHVAVVNQTLNQSMRMKDGRRVFLFAAIGGN